MSLEFSSVNHILIYENSESKCFENVKFLNEISNNWSNYSLATNVYKTLMLIIVVNSNSMH